MSLGSRRAAINSKQIVRSGLVLHLDAARPASYPSSGTTWFDVGGSGYDGTLSGPSYKTGESFSFDGVNDVVTVGSLGVFTAMTICTFMKRNGTQMNWAGIVFSRGTNVTGLNYRSNTLQLGYHWNGSSSTYDWASGLTPPDGEWVMAALSVSSTEARMYMCSSTSITSATNVLSHASTTFDDLKIGEDDQGGRYSKGSMATVSIYDRALSLDEIKQNHEALKGRFPPVADPPVEEG